MPTAPFLRPASVDAAVDLLRERGVNSVVGVRREALYLWRDGRPAYLRPDGGIPNSFELEPLVWETTGLYVNRAARVRSLRRRLDADSCLPLPLTPIEAVDINAPEDFELAEALWRGLATRADARPAVDAPR